jgi:hypothetical protein
MHIEVNHPINRKRVEELIKEWHKEAKERYEKQGEFVEKLKKDESTNPKFLEGARKCLKGYKSEFLRVNSLINNKDYHSIIAGLAHRISQTIDKELYLSLYPTQINVYPPSEFDK